MKISNILAIIFCVFFPVVALADVASSIDGIADKIPVAGSVVVGIGFALELVLRYSKSEKPLSLLHAAAGILNAVAKLAKKLADLADALVGQRLKQ